MSDNEMNKDAIKNLNLDKILENPLLAGGVGFGVFFVVFLLLDIILMNMQGLSLIFNG